MNTVTLNEAHGKHTSGTQFEVVRTSRTTTIVKTAGGKRSILPNNKLVELMSSAPAPGLVEPSEAPIEEVSPETPKIPVVELNAAQAAALVGLGDEDLALDETLEAYIDESGLDPKAAKADLLFIRDHMDKGSKFIESSGKTIEPVLGISMSDTERKVLESLLGGVVDPTTVEGLGVTEVPEPEIEQPTLGLNQIWFTDITGGRLPKSGINHIVNQYAVDHFPEEHRCHIPMIKSSHYWDTEVLEALLLAHILREKALITGLPGTGKSSSVEQFAAWIRQPYMRLGGRGDLESSSFLGYSWADVTEVEGQMVNVMDFKPGMLTQGCMYGYLVTIDEVMKIPPYIQMSMQHLYEKDGYLTIDDKPGTQEDKIVRPIPEFLMILTDNVKGTGDNFDKFAATQMQDTSSLDRISINETLNYLDAGDETKMLSKMFPSVSRDIIKKLVKFAGLVRNGYMQGGIALTLSPRGLIAILDIMGRSLPTERAIELAYLNKIADESELIAIREMIRTVNL